MPIQPTGLTGERVYEPRECKCGCGQWFTPTCLNQKYIDPTHAKSTYNESKRSIKLRRMRSFGVLADPVNVHAFPAEFAHSFNLTDVDFFTDLTDSQSRLAEVASGRN